MSGYPQPRAKAERMAGLLLKYPNKGITRKQLATQCSLPSLKITAPQVTQYWPHIEKLVGEAGYFANRPTYQSDYLCSATNDPLHAVLVALQRERNIITRMINDKERGAALERLTKYPDLTIALNASLTWERYGAHLDSWRRQEQDHLALETQILAQVTQMPKIPVNAKPPENRAAA